MHPRDQVQAQSMTLTTDPADFIAERIWQMAELLQPAKADCGKSGRSFRKKPCACWEEYGSMVWKDRTSSSEKRQGPRAAPVPRRVPRVIHEARSAGPVEMLTPEQEITAPEGQYWLWQGVLLKADSNHADQPAQSREDHAADRDDRGLVERSSELSGTAQSALARRW